MVMIVNMFDQQELTMSRGMDGEPLITLFMLKPLTNLYGQS